MTTRAAHAKPYSNGNGSSVVIVNDQAGSLPAFFLDDPGVRPTFAYLAGAFPSAKADIKYWTVLTLELAEVPEPVLMAAVKEYIRTAEYARMPTVGELLKLCRKHQHEYDVDIQATRDAAQQQEYDDLQAGLRRVTHSVPAADREEIAARIQAAYEATDDWVTADRLIYTYLLDTDGPRVGWYSPTALIAVGITTKARAGRPTGDPSLPLPEALVDRMMDAYPGRFKARYDLRFESLLNPDRFYQD